MIAHGPFYGMLEFLHPVIKTPDPFSLPYLPKHRDKTHIFGFWILQRTLLSSPFHTPYREHCHPEEASSTLLSPLSTVLISVFRQRVRMLVASLLAYGKSHSQLLNFVVQGLHFAHYEFKSRLVFCNHRALRHYRTFVVQI
jgi:hypothetical protein